MERDLRGQEAAAREAQPGCATWGESPGWLLRFPAYRVVETLAPWAGLADGGSFAALLDDPTDAHLIRTHFPVHALARSFCAGPTLEQVALAITYEPCEVKARVWIGGYGGPDEGISVTAVYVRFAGTPSDADSRADRHPALWAWAKGRLGCTGAGEHPWPKPDEITRDRTDVRDGGIWWRLRWGPSRPRYLRS